MNILVTGLGQNEPFKKINDSYEFGSIFTILKNGVINPKNRQIVKFDRLVIFYLPDEEKDELKEVKECLTLFNGKKFQSQKISILNLEKYQNSIELTIDILTDMRKCYSFLSNLVRNILNIKSDAKIYLNGCSSTNKMRLVMSLFVYLCQLNNFENINLAFDSNFLENKNESYESLENNPPCIVPIQGLVNKDAFTMIKSSIAAGNFSFAFKQAYVDKKYVIPLNAFNLLKFTNLIINWKTFNQALTFLNTNKLLKDLFKNNQIIYVLKQNRDIGLINLQSYICLLLNKYLFLYQNKPVDFAVSVSGLFFEAFIIICEEEKRFCKVVNSSFKIENYSDYLFDCGYGDEKTWKISDKFTDLMKKNFIHTGEGNLYNEKVKLKASTSNLVTLREAINIRNNYSIYDPIIKKNNEIINFFNKFEDEKRDVLKHELTVAMFQSSDDIDESSNKCFSLLLEVYNDFVNNQYNGDGLLKVEDFRTFYDNIIKCLEEQL